MFNPAHTPEAQHDRPLSIAVISPDRKRRIVATSTFTECGHVEMREFLDYPPGREDTRQMLERGFDAILIDLDANTPLALELIEAICMDRSTVVMVFSAGADPSLMLQSMRAGAREFLTIPFAQDVVVKALQWVSAHRQEAAPVNKSDARVFAFFGSKGGAGVTTIATNFAVALAEQSSDKTLLIDLNFQLGDAAMNIGVSSTLSVLDALKASSAPDSKTLSPFLAHHPSGLAILPAPDVIHAWKGQDRYLVHLLTLARRQFGNVVIDAGRKIDLKQMNLFEKSITTYLVTQVGIPELRNANRLIAQFNSDAAPKLEIIVNRYQARFLGLTDQHLEKALTQPVRWKVPNDFLAVQQMHRTGVPIVHQKSPIAQVIRQMASSVSDQANTNAVEASSSSAKLRLPWISAAQHIKHGQDMGVSR